MEPTLPIEAPPLESATPDPLPLSPAGPMEDQVTTTAEPKWALAGEALAAVTGIFPKKPMTSKDGEDAQGLLGKAQKEIAKFCKFEKFDDFEFTKPDIDFEEMYGKLGPLSNEEVSTATEFLPNPDLIQAWRFAVDRTRAYLKGAWPVAIRQTPTGPEWTPPPPSVVGRTAAVLRVVEDPLEMLREMNRGVLTPSMVAAVKTCHPEFYKRVTSSMVWQLKLAGEKHRHCPWKHEFQLRLLFEKKPAGIMSFGAPAEPPVAPSPVRLDIEFDSMRTKGQAAP